MGSYSEAGAAGSATGVVAGAGGAIAPDTPDARRCRESDSPGNCSPPSQARGASTSVEGRKVEAGIADAGTAGGWVGREAEAADGSSRRYFESDSPGRMSGVALEGAPEAVCCSRNGSER